MLKTNKVSKKSRHKNSENLLNGDAHVTGANLEERGNVSLNKNGFNVGSRPRPIVENSCTERNDYLDCELGQTSRVVTH